MLRVRREKEAFLLLLYLKHDADGIKSDMEVFRRHPEFQFLRLKHEPVLLLSGLEINPTHRDVMPREIFSK